jgi:hypothetical protein
MMSYEEQSNSEGTNEKLVLRSANEVVAHSLEVLRKEILIRRFSSALRRSGLGAITSSSFAFVDPATAQIKFKSLSSYRFGNLIDFLDHVAGRSTTRVPSPVPAIDTVNVHIEQLKIIFNDQPPKEFRT